MSTLTVDLEQFERNLKILAEVSGGPIMPIVKANAYGHGIIPISRRCEQTGVAFLGVARLEEANAIRQAGISSRILIMGVLPPGSMAETQRIDADVAVWRPDQVEEADAAGGAASKPVRVHIKLDVGMGRLGILPAELPQLIGMLCGRKGIEIAGVFSHLPEADDADAAGTTAHVKTFRECLDSLAARGISPRWVHLANSAAALRFPGARLGLVRLGAAAYGIEPTRAHALPAGIRPIARWTTSIMNTKKLPADHGVSYGGLFVTSRATIIGVIPVGYADGFKRSASFANTVLVGGKEAPVRGLICMDYAMIDLTGLGVIENGCEVTILGSAGGKALTAETLAKRWGTNNYDVVSGISSRVERRYR